MVDYRQIATRSLGQHEVDELGEGEDTVGFRTGDLIVRVAKHPGAATHMRLQMDLLPLVAKAVDVAVPEPVWIRDVDGCTVMAHVAPPGTPLEPQMWKALTGGQRDQVVDDVGTFLAQLHTVKAPGLQECRPYDWLRPNVDVIRSLVVPRIRNEAAAYREARLEDLPRRGPDVLVHRDLGEGHLLVEHGRLTAVIDFGDAALGEEALDTLFVVQVPWAGGAFPRLRHPDDVIRHERWNLWEALVWAARCLEIGEDDRAAQALAYLTGLR